METKEPINKNSERQLEWIERPRTWIWIVIGMFVVCVVYYYLLYLRFEEPSDRGSFGDAFGLITAITSGTALIIMAISLVFQRRDLQETIKEMRTSASAQTQLARAQESHNLLLREQLELQKQNVEIEQLRSELDYNMEMMNHATQMILAHCNNDTNGMLSLYLAKDQRTNIAEYFELWTIHNNESSGILKELYSLNGKHYHKPEA